MCGIIGIASYKDISKEILESLKKLEYRGYDSAGISTINNGEIVENKCAGKVSDLEKLIKKTSLSGNIGIGHVRWQLMALQTRQMPIHILQKKYRLCTMVLLKIQQLLKKN